MMKNDKISVKINSNQNLYLFNDFITFNIKLSEDIMKIHFGKCMKVSKTPQVFCRTAKRKNIVCVSECR